MRTSIITCVLLSLVGCKSLDEKRQQWALEAADLSDSGLCYEIGGEFGDHRILVLMDELDYRKSQGTFTLSERECESVGQQAYDKKALKLAANKHHRESTGKIIEDSINGYYKGMNSVNIHYPQPVNTSCNTIGTFVNCTSF